jgi:hypothetical protein
MRQGCSRSGRQEGIAGGAVKPIHTKTLILREKAILQNFGQKQ